MKPVNKRPHKYLILLFFLAINLCFLNAISNDKSSVSDTINKFDSVAADSSQNILGNDDESLNPNSLMDEIKPNNSANKIFGISIDTATIITAIFALYGAVLSTINIVKQISLTKRNIKVIISIGFINRGRGLEDTLIIEAQNRGFRTVTITSNKILLPNENTYVSVAPNSDKQLPYRLTEADNIHFFFEIHQIANDLIRENYSNKIDIVASVSDGAGNQFKSKPFKFDLLEWNSLPNAEID